MYFRGSLRARTIRNLASDTDGGRAVIPVKEPGIQGGAQ